MNTMIKTTKNVLLAAVFGIGVLSLNACDKNNDGENPTPELEVKTVEDLDGSETPAYYDFSNGEKVGSTSTTWDIKFVGTTLELGNGASAQLAEGVFDSYIAAPESGYTTDDIGGSGSWYNYTGESTDPKHAILAIPGKIIVLKTHDNRYAKVEIISYYKGNPDTSSEDFKDYQTPGKRPTTKFYTFRYVIQSDGSPNLK